MDRETRSERRRFLTAAALGSLLALVLDVLALSGGHLDALRDTGALGSFFDVQGHALLHGHLAVDPLAVGIEGFLIHGRTYLYYGPVPALLRLPVLALTHRLDGRLTQISMLIAVLVLLGSGVRLHWRVRRLVAPHAPVERLDTLAAFLMPVALGAGSVVLYLVGWAVVYDETELWGAALAVAGIEAVVALIGCPRARRIMWAGALATLDINTRVSVGLGPVIALGAVGLGAAAQLAGARLGDRGSRAAGTGSAVPGAGRLLARMLDALGALGPRLRSQVDARTVAPGPRARSQVRARTVMLLAAATLVPVAVSAAVNEAKLGQPFGIPLAAQVQSHVDPHRKAALAANHDSLFGAKFVPTTLWETIRPDAVGGVRAFPFIGVPRRPGAVLGHVVFDTLDPSLSATTSMTLLCLLCLGALAPLARRRELRPLLGVLAATALAYIPALTIAYTATRYLADLLPFLFLGALVGLCSLLAARRAGSLRRSLLITAMAVLSVWGVAINGAAALVNQFLLASNTPSADRAAFVRLQDRVDRWLGRTTQGLGSGPRLPAPSGALGDLFIVGRCAGLYVRSYDSWLPVERTTATGLEQLRVRFPVSVPTTPAALLGVGRGRSRITLVTSTASQGTTFSVRVPGASAARSAPQRLGPGPVDVTLAVDPLEAGHVTTVSVQGRPVLSALTPGVDTAQATIGGDPRDPGLARFAGSVKVIPARTPACDELAGRVGLGRSA